MKPNGLSTGMRNEHPRPGSKSTQVEFPPKPLPISRLAGEDEYLTNSGKYLINSCDMNKHQSRPVAA
jgi:hypothetical protein